MGLDPFIVSHFPSTLSSSIHCYENLNFLLMYIRMFVSLYMYVYVYVSVCVRIPITAASTEARQPHTRKTKEN